MRKHALSTLCGAVLVSCASAVAAPAPGSLHVKFFYDAPSTVEPTYHTAIWIEDQGGKIVKTLYVSQELSDTAYKMGNACPDWVKVANWSAMPKADVAAVTAPTPSVGTGDMTFDLAKLGLAPGTYGFRFQVHISETYNILYRGQFTTSGPDAEVALETVYGPGKLETTDQFVRDVEVRYLAPR